MNCPNINLQEYKDLEKAVGENRAHYLWDKNNGNSLDLTPNGDPSLLYKELLVRTNGNVVKALELKADYYSHGYLNKDNWFKNVELFNVVNSNLSTSAKAKAQKEIDKLDKNKYDINGEPLLESIEDNTKNLKYNLETAKADILDILNKQLKIFSSKNKSSAFATNLENIIKNIKESGLEEINLIKLIADSKIYTQQANNRISKNRDKLKNIKYLSDNEKRDIISELVEAKEFISAYNILDEIQKIYINAGKPIPNELDIDDAMTNRKLAISTYHDVMYDILADWLYPSLRATNDRLQAIGKDEITLEVFKNILKQGSNDIGMFEKWLGALSSSSEIGAASISITLKRLLENVRLEDRENLYSLSEEYDKLEGNKNNVSEFNRPFIKNIQFIEKAVTLDKNGNELLSKDGKKIYHTIITSKKAIHLPFLYDVFEKIQNEFRQSLKGKTIKEEKLAWKQWFSENTQIINPEQLIATKKAELSPKEYEDWLIKNTTEREIYKVEDVWNYDTMTNVIPNSINTVTNRFRTYTGEFVQPSDKYRNVEFDRLYNTNAYFRKLYDLYDKYNQKLPPNQRLKYGVLPQIRKSGWDRVQSAGGDLGAQMENMKAYMTETFKFTGYDKANGLVKLSGQDAKQVPSYYLDNIEDSDVSEDLLSSILLFSSMSNTYDQLSSAEPYVDILKDMLLGNPKLGLAARQVVETKSDGNPVVDLVTKLPKIKTSDININQRVIEFIDTVFYGEKEVLSNVQILDKTVNLNKLGGFISGITAANSMMLNLIGGINNITIGQLAVFIEGIGGKFYTKADTLAAQSYYSRNILDNAGDFGKAKELSMLNLLMDEYDFIQGEFKDSLGRSISSTGAKRLFKSDTLFFINNGGEHYNQSVGALSMLSGKKFTGDRFETLTEYTTRKLGNFNQKDPNELTQKDKAYLERYNAKLKEYNAKKVEIAKEFGKYNVSLLDAYDKKDGKLIIKDQYKPYWSESDRFDLMNKIHSINKSIHGNYAEFDKSLAQRQWLGKLMIMFRKYLYTGFRRRYGNEYIDLELGDSVQGYYNTFFGKLASDIKNYGLQSALTNEYTTEQLEARNKVMTDLAVVVASMLILTLVSASNGDDDDFLKAHILVQAARLRGDVLMYMNPSDLLRVIKNPAVSLSTIEKFAALINQTVPIYTDGVTEQYDKRAGIWEKGDYKIVKKIVDIIPIGNQLNNFLSPEDQLAVFNKPY